MAGIPHYSLDLEGSGATAKYVPMAPKVDFRRHLSELSKARQPTPLKGMYKYIAIPGMISMAGGLPSPEYFPFDSISAEVLKPEAFQSSVSGNSSSNGLFTWLWKLFGVSPETSRMEVPKYTSDPTDPSAIQLSVALQYGPARGLLSLQTFVQAFTTSVFQPLNPETTTLAHVGNTDGWDKIAETLCNPGEFILTEEWTYPGATIAAWPHHVRPFGIPMDGQGMRADSLEDILTNWVPEERGAPRPHVMYTIPVGQNPSGATMGVERKRAIYAVCVKYDVIIVEDDPYYFLQMSEYTPAALRTPSPSKAHLSEAEEQKEFIESLVPNYLKFDYQGRVVRLDTFSKTIAPGSRLGWFTCNPLFAERLERAQESTVQGPSGFSQALIAKLLIDHWKYPGYIRWLQGIRAQYTFRRDAIIDALAEAFDLEEEWTSDGGFAPLKGSVRVYIARSKRSSKRIPGNEEKKGKILFTFVPPTGGMFLWLKVHLYNHLAYSPDAPPPKTVEDTLENKLWIELANHKVLFAPGWMFSSSPTLGSATEQPLLDVSPSVHIDDRYGAISEGGKYGHFRTSYSTPTPAEITEGMRRFAAVMQENFQD